MLDFVLVLEAVLGCVLVCEGVLDYVLVPEGVLDCVLVAGQDGVSENLDDDQRDEQTCTLKSKSK